jgi:hypothetical protein
MPALRGDKNPLLLQRIINKNSPFYGENEDGIVPKSSFTKYNNQNHNIASLWTHQKTTTAIQTSYPIKIQKCKPTYFKQTTPAFRQNFRTRTNG